MKKTLFVFLLRLGLMAAPAFADDLPGYEAQPTQQVPGAKLSLDCVLAAPVDELTLKALGEKVYGDYDGKAYKNVFIMWYLPHYEKGAGAWGLTNFSNGKIQVRIMALQG